MRVYMALKIETYLWTLTGITTSGQSETGINSYERALHSPHSIRTVLTEPSLFGEDLTSSTGGHSLIDRYDEENK